VGANLPPAARAGLEGPGGPLDPALGRRLGSWLGSDFSSVRTHTDAAAGRAARELGVQAFTFGHHVVFGHGAWTPGTERGLRLLRHELMHVAQQASGDASSESTQEREAAQAATGAAPRLIRGGTPRPVLRFDRGDVLRVIVTLGQGGRARFEIEIEGGVSITGTGTARGLAPGEYRLRSGERGASEMAITQVDGSALPQASRFWTTVPPAVVRALERTYRTVPLVIRAREEPGDASSPEPATQDPQRQEIDALPQRIRDFLFTATGPSLRREDYPTVLRIAHAIRDLSDAELAEYRARTTSTTTNIEEFERSVNAWLAEVRARNAAITGEETATRRLFGLESLYDLYSRWQEANNLGGQWYPTGTAAPAGQVAQYEATPFPALRVPSDGTGWQLYYQLRRALDASGFANVAAFEAALRQFLVGFRERAFYIALESLGRYEHFLVEQQTRYRDPAVLDALYTRLAPARAQTRAADRFEQATRFVGMDPDDRGAHEVSAEAREEHRVMLAGATRAVTSATATTDPLVAQRGFDPLELARQDRTGVGAYLQRYISERLENIRSTRRNLQGDHELVFRFDQLVTTTKQRADIDENTIWSRVIAAHSAPSFDETLIGIFAGVLAVALTFATAGTGLPAVLVALGSLGLSTYMAIESYEDYAVRSDAYGAGLLSREPWFGWVVIAVIGAGLDLAAVGGVLSVLRPAAAALDATGDLPAFNAAVRDLVDSYRVSSASGGASPTFNAAVRDLVENPRLRQAILEAGAARAEARAAWREVANAPTVAPRGALRGSLFGLDVVIDAALALPRTMYALWLQTRAGVRTFQRWIRTPEAVELFGDVAQFSPARLREVQAVFEQASAALQRVATRGRELGMTTAEIEGTLQWWARWQRGTADDLIRVLDQRRALAIDPAVLTRMGAEVDVSRVRLVAASIDDPTLRAALLSDDRVWRLLHNADYDPAVLVGAWREFRRPRPPSQRLDAASFGEYLYNSSRYSTVLDRTPSRPLTAVIPNWGSLVGAERTRAVFAVAEPRLAAALAGTGTVPGLNPQTVSELRALLQSDVLGQGVTVYEGARSTVMGLANEIIGRTTTTEAELRAVLALTESSGSTGSIGERFVAQRLTHTAFLPSDIAHPSFSRAEIPGLRGSGETFVPDRVMSAAHVSVDVKTGYAGGSNIADQAHNYDLLRAVSVANPTGPVASRLGGPLRGHAWIVLPGSDAATTSAQTVARRMWSQLQAEGLTTQRVFYLDDTGVLQQVTGATTQVRAGATIHEAVGLRPPPSTSP